MEKKNRKFGLKILIFVFIIIFILLYSYVYWLPNITNKFKDTYVIEYGTVSFGEDCKYLVYRDEMAYKASHTGSIDRIANEGELVRANTEILSIGSKTYTNSKRGIVSYYYDGLEDRFELEDLKDLKSSIISEIESSYVDSEGKKIDIVKECKTSDISYGDVIYKIIDNNTWYICTWVSKAIAANLKLDSSVSIVINDSTIEMKIYNIVEQGLETLLILYSNDYYEIFDQIRIGDAKLITTSSTGLIIETSSIVTLDGVDGVYVINSLGDTSFVPIKIYLKTEDKTVVARNYFYDANGNYTYTVKIYDTVLRSK